MPDGVKFSQFSPATPDSSDQIVGLHGNTNARFSVANFILAVRQGLESLFVPMTRKVNNKALSSDITLNASDVGAVDTADVGAAGGIAELDSTGKVPTSQLPPIASTAADVTYDNTGSGLTADDVQEAIDELAQGGGGGTTVVANPAGAATDTLTKLQVSNTIYSVSGGGSGANEAQLAYVETGTTASQNYTAGQYIALNGLLYTADTAIASGATFYTSGGNKNLTECVGGGFNSVYKLVSYAITHFAFRVNNVVFVHFRSNVDLGGGTTTVFLSGLPVPDTSQTHTWQFPVNVNSGLTTILPGYVTVESNGDLSILVLNNGSIVTSGRFTVSIFLMYLTV